NVNGIAGSRGVTQAFQIYGLAPISSIGGWQASGATVQVHYPGTVGITSAGPGIPLPLSPIITDKNGTRLDVTNVTLNAGEGTTSGDSNKYGSNIYVVEPVTGDRFVAISPPA